MMAEVIYIEDVRFLKKVKKGFKNWRTRFKRNFGPETKFSDLPTSVLSFLAKGKGESVYYIYDLIMGIRDLGSGMEFPRLTPPEKMFVIDQYLFLLDQFRFECMKRLDWIESYPAESYPIAVLVRDFERIFPFLQAKAPVLKPDFPGYKKYQVLSEFDKETFIRRLIPKALERIERQSEK